MFLRIKCPATRSTVGGDVLFHLQGLKYEWKLDIKTTDFQVTVTATVCIWVTVLISSIRSSGTILLSRGIRLAGSTWIFEQLNWNFRCALWWTLPLRASNTGRLGIVLPRTLCPAGPPKTHTEMGTLGLSASLCEHTRLLPRVFYDRL